MERKLAFGSALKEVRVRKEIAQEQLGASQSFVSTIERGIRSPTIEKMEEFAERLGVNPVPLIVLMQDGQEGDVDELLAKIRDEIRALKRVGVQPFFGLYEKATLAFAVQVAFFISCAYLVQEFGKFEICSVLAEK